MANGVRLSTLRRKIKKNTTVHTWQDVVELFRDHPVAGNISVECWDTEYVSLPEFVWKDFLKHSDADKYIANRRDCDDFCKILRGDAAELALSGCGLAVDISSYHAYICLLVHDDEGALGLLFVEPQTDGYVRVGRGNYKLATGKVIF